MDLSKKCVFCDSTSSLDTVMTVKVDNHKFKIGVCENCEDYATPKAVKEAAASQINKQNEIDQEKADLIKRAREMGLVIAEPDQVPIHSSEQPEPEPERPQLPAKKKPKPLAPGRVEKIESSQALQMGHIHTPTSASGSGAAAGISWSGGQENQYSLDREFATRDGEVAKPKDFITESQIVEGREGIPVQLPAKVQGDSGQTDIHIIKVSPQEMLDRFKALNENPIPGAYDSQRDCTFCNATGRTRVGGHKCPKCNGRGYRDYLSR